LQDAPHKFISNGGKYEFNGYSFWKSGFYSMGQGSNLGVLKTQFQDILKKNVKPERAKKEGLKDRLL